MDFKPYLPRLRRYAAVLAARAPSLEADDLVQSTILRAVERADSFIAGEPPLPWLLSIMHSISVDEIRAAQVRLRAVPSIRALTWRDDQPDARLLGRDVLRWLATLPASVQRTLELVGYHGLMQRDVARIEGVDKSVICRRIARARNLSCPIRRPIL